MADATNDYLEAQDLLSEFLNEFYVRDIKGKVLSSELFSKWKSWMEERGERPGRQRTLLDALEQKGLKYERTKHKREVWGLRLRTEEDNSEELPEEPAEQPPKASYERW